MRSSSALLWMVLLGCQAHAQPAPADAKAAENQPAAYVGSRSARPAMKISFNAIQKSPHQAIERGQEARVGWQDLRILPWPREQARRIRIGGGDQESGQAAVRRGGQDLPQMPSESADARRTDSEQPCQEPDRLHVVPLDSRQGPTGLVARKAAAVNRTVRRLPRERLEPVSEAVQAPAAGRGDVLRGLPQSARELPARHDADVRGERTGLFPLSRR